MVYHKSQILVVADEDVSRVGKGCSNVVIHLGSVSCGLLGSGPLFSATRDSLKAAHHMATVSLKQST